MPFVTSSVLVPRVHGMLSWSFIYLGELTDHVNDMRGTFAGL